MSGRIISVSRISLAVSALALVVSSAVLTPYQANAEGGFHLDKTVSDLPSGVTLCVQTSDTEETCAPPTKSFTSIHIKVDAEGGVLNGSHMNPAATGDPKCNQVDTQVTVSLAAGATFSVLIEATEEGASGPTQFVSIGSVGSGAGRDFWARVCAGANVKVPSIS